MIVGLLNIHLQVPGCTSLKQKRSLIKPVLSRLHREFNISAAEIGLNDHWQETVICCAMVSNNLKYTEKALQTVLHFVESHFPNLNVLDHKIEII